MYVGYMQILLNVLYYTDKFTSESIKLESCTQRMCYVGETYTFNNNSVIEKTTGCSPILLHKGVDIKLL